MSDMAAPRRPATFKLDDPRVKLAEREDERIARGEVRVFAEPDAATLPAVVETALPPPRKGLRWGAILLSALGGLVLLGAGLGAVNLVQDLFARSEGLGYVGALLAALATLALVAIITREILGLTRLAAIETLQARAAAVLVSDDRAESRAVLDDLLKIAQENPHLARARATLKGHAGDIIDGADMIRLAERKLMTPLDREAKRLVSTAAQQVALVTAISPRALVDMLFVLAAALRLVRQLARLYGGRPGALGLIRLLRQTVSHLAITGGVAASDSLIQQMLGHGVAAKLSSRLGEGLLNGLLTARLGLATMETIRPLPFETLPRPALSDLAGDLLRRAKTTPE